MEESIVTDVIAQTGLNSNEYLATVYWGNSVLEWMVAGAVFAAAWFILALFRNIVIARLKKLSARTSSTVDDAIINFLQGIGIWLYLAISLFMSVQHLTLPELADMVITAFFLLSVVAEVIRLIERIVATILAAKMESAGGEENKSMTAAVILIIRIILWGIGLMLILSNLGINVNSLIASLGIGGLAISLALQPVLTDVFSSFSIVIDKPFQVGDFIVIGEFKGTVKHIGLKTTRLEALQGEELVISNAELTNARVQNFKKMRKRRIVFTIGVVYGTPQAALKAIPGIVEKIVDEHAKTEFDRATFSEFADSSLNFEVVYYVQSGDYKEYMNTQQDINLAIVEVFEKENIEMAFPTRTVHMISSS